MRNIDIFLNEIKISIFISLNKKLNKNEYIAKSINFNLLLWLLKYKKDVIRKNF